jgi:hypothetical protein
MTSPSATPNRCPYQNEPIWPRSEKTIARKAFDAAKPSTGIKWARLVADSKTPRKAVKTVAAPESGRGARDKTLQAENDDNDPQ